MLRGIDPNENQYFKEEEKKILIKKEGIEIIIFYQLFDVNFLSILGSTKKKKKKGEREREQ